MGNDADTKRRWHEDALDACSVDDRVWGWGIRSTDVLHHERAKIKDDVLIKMLLLGILDPKPGNTAWSSLFSLQQGIRLVSNAIVRVVQRVIQVEEKVHSDR